jgi:hypothetical protein
LATAIKATSNNGADLFEDLIKTANVPDKIGNKLNLLSGGRVNAHKVLKDTPHATKVGFLETITEFETRGFSFEKAGTEVKIISGTEGVNLGKITDDGLDIEDFGYIADNVAASNIKKLPNNFKVFDNGNDLTGKLEVVIDAYGNTKFRWSTGSGKPQWLKTIEEGNNFNANRKDAFPYNEIYLEKTGGSYVRLDSYDPVVSEITSRKFSQLSDVNESTAISYLNELNNKYPPGTKIAEVPSNLTGSNQGILSSGDNITGQMILEVPVQLNGIPQSVLDKADDLLILIRDVNGNVY